MIKMKNMYLTKNHQTTRERFEIELRPKNISQQKLHTLNDKSQMSKTVTVKNWKLGQTDGSEPIWNWQGKNQKSCETFLYLLGCFVSKVALFFSSKKQRYQHVNNQRVDMMKELNRFYFRKTLLQKGYY